MWAPKVRSVLAVVVWVNRPRHWAPHLDVPQHPHQLLLHQLERCQGGSELMPLLQVPAHACRGRCQMQSGAGQHAAREQRDAAPQRSSTECNRAAQLIMQMHWATWASTNRCRRELTHHVNNADGVRVLWLRMQRTHGHSCMAGSHVSAHFPPPLKQVWWWWW
jgi:hypothetical protein